MNIVQFNEEFKKRLKIAKEMELYSERNARVKWMELVKFIVEFAKSDECPPSLRIKIANNAEAILKRIKNELNTGADKSKHPISVENPGNMVYSGSDSDELITGLKKTQENDEKEERLSEEEMFHLLMKIPDVNSMDDNSKNKASDSESKPSLDQQLPDSDKIVSGMNLPKGIVEIKPSESPEITFKMPSKDSSEKTASDVDFEKGSEPIFLDITREILGPEIDHMVDDAADKRNNAGDHADVERSSDSDGPNPGGDTEKGRHCRICGALLDKDEIICSECGAENPL